MNSTKNPYKNYRKNFIWVRKNSTSLFCLEKHRLKFFYQVLKKKKTKSKTCMFASARRPIIFWIRICIASALFRRLKKMFWREFKKGRHESGPMPLNELILTYRRCCFSPWRACEVLLWFSGFSETGLLYTFVKDYSIFGNFFHFRDSILTNEKI